MLKWAVHNVNRPSNFTDINQSDPDMTNPIRRPKTRRTSNSRSRVRDRRKSSVSEMANLHRKISNRDKENNLTSTPLPLHRQSLSPLRRFDSLRDLSNIPPIPESSLSTPLLYRAPNNETSTLVKNDPLQYASTLPTFDVEYSPCSIVPGPILALRGMGIADSYFEKPRYLANDIPTTQTKRLKTDQLGSFQFEIPRTIAVKHDQKQLPLHQHGEESMSSSRMGDMTLDRMIDAILESARKERRNLKAKQQSCPVMSPTYTAAEDPASDLNEIWDPMSEKYRQTEDHRRRSEFNEREVRTPEGLNDDTIQNNVDPLLDDPATCHLRRQPAVRRKRKLLISAQNFIKSSVKSSTQKLFANNQHLKKSLDDLVNLDTPKGYPNLSPDSGRNSASDLEESGEYLNYSRRRLSFSPSTEP